MGLRMLRARMGRGIMCLTLVMRLILSFRIATRGSIPCTSFFLSLFAEWDTKLEFFAFPAIFTVTNSKSSTARRITRTRTRSQRGRRTPFAGIPSRLSPVRG